MSVKFMNNVFKKDLYRYYGEKGESFIERLLRPTELKYIALFRKANTCGKQYIQFVNGDL